MSTPILPELRSRLPHLSRAAARVARLVIARPGDTSRMAISDVAQAADVSEPTVIRLCRALGYAGWPAFKVQLAASQISGVPYVHSALTPGDGVPALTGKVFDNAASALLRVRNGLDPAQIEAATTRAGSSARISTARAAAEERAEA